jgi:uncharacterized membrane protein
MATDSTLSDSSARTTPRRQPIAIQDASSWILRVGVMLSVSVMLFGLLFAFFVGGLTPQLMERTAFSDNFSALGAGLWRLQPFAFMELGVLLLVLTPILRVFTAMVLFALEERDRLYTAVTLLVLMMTLGSLLFIR